MSDKEAGVGSTAALIARPANKGGSGQWTAARIAPVIRPGERVTARDVASRLRPTPSKIEINKALRLLTETALLERGIRSRSGRASNAYEYWVRS